MSIKFQIYKVWYIKIIQTFHLIAFHSMINVLINTREQLFSSNIDQIMINDYLPLTVTLLHVVITQYIYSTTAANWLKKNCFLMLKLFNGRFRHSNCTVKFWKSVLKIIFKTRISNPKKSTIIYVCTTYICKCTTTCNGTCM